jgi:hypothetical protein
MRSGRRRLVERGPASKTGLKPGDHILAVRDEPVSSLASLWQRVWAPARRREVVLRVERDKEDERRILSTDRLLKTPKLQQLRCLKLCLDQCGAGAGQVHTASDPGGPAFGCRPSGSGHHASSPRHPPSRAGWSWHQVAGRAGEAYV